MWTSPLGSSGFNIFLSNGSSRQSLIDLVFEATNVLSYVQEECNIVGIAHDKVTATTTTTVDLDQLTLSATN